jgi:hypothetical protein
MGRWPAAKPTLGRENWNFTPEAVVLVMVRGSLKGVAVDDLWWCEGPESDWVPGVMSGFALG